MDRQYFFKLRQATVMPDGQSVTAARAGRELLRQRVAGGSQRYPSHGSYLRYSVGANYVRSRTVAPPAPQTTVPDAPTIPSVTRGNQQATIVFTAPTNTGGFPITNYKYSTDNGSTWTLRNPVSTLSPLVISGLTNGTAYKIKLLAVNAAGDGAASIASSVTPATTPAAPTGLSVTPASGQVTVSFTPGSDGGSQITNYEYSTDNGGSFAEFTPETGAVSSVVITGLTNERTYDIKFRAVSAVGTGAASVNITATPSVFIRTLFTTVGSDTWTVPSNINSIEYLVVGGGGGGGGSWDTAGAGGGGGGEVITGTLSVTPGDTINITVGAGGAGGTSNIVAGTSNRTAIDGSDGLVSTLTYGATTISAAGGGKGYIGGSNPSGDAAGSGGIAPVGGNSSTGGDGGRRPGAGGGGGGAGGAGSDGIQSAGTVKAVGGIGLTSTVYSGTYGVGGTSGFGTNTQGPNYNFPGTVGANNTGNGGGGASVGVSSHATGGAGGSGIVAIKYVS